MFILPLGDDVDHRDFPVAGILLTVANVTVFVYMLRLGFGSADGAELADFCRRWGLVPAELAHGSVVPLLSHMFLHGGIWHIVGNMLCLWAFAHTLESSLGTARLIACFLIWGIAGGLMHAAVHWGSEISLVGASGAIAGMMGAYWIAFGPMTKIRTLILVLWHPIRTDIPAGAFMAVWMFMQLFGAAGSGDDAVGVAWFAHLGGFLAGALTAVCLRGHISRLVVTRGGDLKFELPTDDAPAEREEPDGALEAPPTNCPYCNTPLGEEHQLAPNLLRCPNPGCQRCVYLEEIAAAP